MWIRHTEDPSQGQGEHHSLAIIRSYLKLEGVLQKARGMAAGGVGGGGGALPEGL